ncbi:unnamed protein product [Lampetra fluviatilis]
MRSREAPRVCPLWEHAEQQGGEGGGLHHGLLLSAGDEVPTAPSDGVGRYVPADRSAERRGLLCDSCLGSLGIPTLSSL